MPQYLVKEPCAYVNASGAAVQHMEGGVVAEIPEDAAAALGDAVQPLVTGPVPDLVNPTPFPEADKPRRGKSASAIHEAEAGGDG
jgi:hypothetical protein